MRQEQHTHTHTHTHIHTYTASTRQRIANLETCTVVSSFTCTCPSTSSRIWTSFCRTQEAAHCGERTPLTTNTHAKRVQAHNRTYSVVQEVTACVPEQLKHANLHDGPPNTAISILHGMAVVGLQPMENLCRDATLKTFHGKGLTATGLPIPAARNTTAVVMLLDCTTNHTAHYTGDSNSRKGCHCFVLPSQYSKHLCSESLRVPGARHNSVVVRGGSTISVMRHSGQRTHRGSNETRRRRGQTETGGAQPQG